MEAREETWQPMNLVASVIVKNELGRYLQACIGSLREFCDHIAVLDDGSTDRTPEWLYDNTDSQMVVRYIGADDGFFAGHEGRRRQALLDFTMEQNPTHILSIDADEFIADGQIVRAFCDRPKLVGTVSMQEVWGYDEGGLTIRQDGGWREHPVPILYRTEGWQPDLWRIQDRALACGREPVAVRRKMGNARMVGTQVLHFGWANPATRQERYDRYAVADGGQFHASRHLESILWPDDQIKVSRRPWPNGLKERLM